MTKKKHMTFLEYAEAAAQFRLPSADSAYVSLNLIAEIGELYGKWAKSIRDGSQPSEQEIKHELGDILWMFTALCHDCGSSIAEVASMNIDKLTKRKAKNTLHGSGDNR
jgi:NTP pyrophosphatase (non-canonical NTP hydrolase)